MAGGSARLRRGAGCGVDTPWPPAKHALRRLARRAARTDSVSGPLRTPRAAQSESVLRLLRRLRQSTDVRDRAREPVRVDRRSAGTRAALGRRAADSRMGT